MNAKLLKLDDGVPSSQITCVVPRQSPTVFHQLLGSLGVNEFTLQSARRTLLSEHRQRRGVRPLLEELVDVARFHIPTKSEDAVVSALTDRFGFGEPGHGSLVIRQTTLSGISPGVPTAERPLSKAGTMQGLAGLCCIVPRGEGQAIARVSLEAGLCAPVVTYAKGVGSRGKLGLIRITIPVEKEIVTMQLSRHDIDEAFRLVSDVMKLGRPGAGFCYWYPLSGGILDTRIWVGRQPYVASMEQVIATLDVLTGGTTWRRKAERASGIFHERPLTLASYTMNGPEGEMEAALSAALEAGAGGATQSLMRRESLGTGEHGSSAREVTDLVIDKALLPRIHEAVSGTGIFKRDGFVEVTGVGASSGYHTSRTSR
jgi:nitrogen regulatory protein PII